MDLFILRHGEASYEASSDEERPLTLRGEAETRRIILNCAETIPGHCKIIASPYRRAQQTAAIVSELLQRPIEASWEALQPASRIDPVLEKINNSDFDSLLLVSHQPLVGLLLNQLAGLSPGQESMGTSSLAYLSGDDALPSCMALQWLSHPH